MARFSLGIASRFALVVGVLLPSLGAMAFVGIQGMQSGRDTANSLYSDHLVTVRDASRLQIALQDADVISLQLFSATDPAVRTRLITDLVTKVSPAVSSSIVSVATESVSDPLERPRAAVIEASWLKFQQLLASGAIAGVSGPTGKAGAGAQVTTILDPATAATESVIATEGQEARQAYADGLASYRSSIRWMVITMIIALLAVAAVVGWLIRSVLRRTLQYSAFAADITRGDYTRRLEPSGGDELADLGRALDDLALRRQAEDLYGDRQFEFTDTLQVTETEQEAHNLVKRHLERSLSHSTVTVLNRNNSADRLQAVTTVTAESSLARGLESAKPRSCLAVRMARPHHGTHGTETLLMCPVCAGCPGQTTCTPLLVGGEVIGSIVANHLLPLTDDEQRSIREVTIQAAPVLGNLRNLAIAELRAATDSLTGLPNKRSLEDTVKRLVAQSLRSASPLTALMCDLDHFRSINDRFGHSRGDEVLAAVGAAFGDTLRAGDFAGRYGGEEFLVLLPGTDSAGGAIIAERIRAAVAAVQIATVDQRLTLSIGVAGVPEHAMDSETLVRDADRALYAAKNGGRDRVEVSGTPAASPEDAPLQLAASAAVISPNGSSHHRILPEPTVPNDG